MTTRDASRSGRAAARAPVSWSEEREATFLATLAATCSVRGAAREAGLSSASVYRRRDAHEAFRAGWAAALREGYVRLETEMLGRAINGVRKPVWFGGKKVGSVVEYSDRLALSLLARYRDGAPATPKEGAAEQEARAALIEALARMNRGMGGQG